MEVSTLPEGGRGPGGPVLDMETEKAPGADKTKMQEDDHRPGPGSQPGSGSKKRPMERAGFVNGHAELRGQVGLSLLSSRAAASSVTRASSNSKESVLASEKAMIVTREE